MSGPPALLPEVVAVALYFLRCLAFEGAECVVQRVALRLAHQKVDVLGHEYVAVYLEAMSLAQSFEPGLEACVGAFAVQAWEPSIATEGDEGKIAFVLVPREAERHGTRVGARWAGADRTFVR
jgi:hypothetical protein